MPSRLLIACAAALLAFGAGPAAAAEDEIVFGAAVSLTGKYSTNGMNTKNGYELAVKRINEMGGVAVGGRRYRIRVKYYDDESTPARAAQLVERLINQDKVQFVLGPYSSGLTKAIAPVTEKYRIPMVEANGASRSLFNKGYRYLFAVLSTSEQYLSSAVALLAEQLEKTGRKPSSARIALAMENDPFSQDVRAGIIDDARRYGMRVVIDDKLPPELNDMSATLTKVKALRPDALFVSGHARGAALAVRQIAEMRVDVPMVAMTHCDSAKIIQKFGEKAEYTLCASQWDRHLAYSDRWFGTANDFAELFEKTYGYAPPYQAAESAAGVLVYVDAIQRAQSLDPQKVRDALAATDLMTFYGPIRFDETGKNIAKPMVLYQVQDGAYRVVAPTKWAAAKLRWPTPPWSQR
ncbi:amino acid ABC transporter substrate-binding protein [Inmirania thermothiophila]|uniref:Amino acid/amide ABC transporter substrate-binding protein (HAAT family) n=1 Tax=Inmirania thermothiophila TaxID=1750597 RepID=A0A3N1YB11_9GAMM|nr:amino acid ABC transporter substrate-binding protein [Inmirania thermothiophila]ROR34577.1 amino acid/amide ABC transporter substrate-binding protein (HAAT family) [Inmirania thermothiophila]